MVACSDGQKNATSSQRNAISGLVIPCSNGSIPSVTIAYLDLEPHDDDEIVLIIDDSERSSRYTICVISQQVATLLKNKPCDHELSLHDAQAKIHTAVVHQTT